MMQTQASTPINGMPIYRAPINGISPGSRQIRYMAPSSGTTIINSPFGASGTHSGSITPGARVMLPQGGILSPAPMMSPNIMQHPLHHNPHQIPQHPLQSAHHQH